MKWSSNETAKVRERGKDKDANTGLKDKTCNLVRINCTRGLNKRAWELGLRLGMSA